MKWMVVPLLGYVILMCGIIAALWLAGILNQIRPTWTTIGVVIAIGLDIMIEVTSGGERESIDIGHH